MLQDLNGKRWPDVLANRMLHHIRSVAIAQLRDRDVKLANGRPLTIEKRLPSGNVKVVIDPGVAYSRHSGEDTQRLVRKRWVDFCSHPRDAATFAAKFQKTEREKLMATYLEQGEEIEQTLQAAGVTVVVTDVVPPIPEPEPDAELRDDDRAESAV